MYTNTVQLIERTSSKKYFSDKLRFRKNTFLTMLSSWKNSSYKIYLWSNTFPKKHVSNKMRFRQNTFPKNTFLTKYVSDNRNFRSNFRYINMLANI